MESLMVALIQFSRERDSERIIFRLGQYLMNIWTRLRRLLFLTHGNDVQSRANITRVELEYHSPQISSLLQ